MESLAGFDYSISSPALCIHPADGEFSFDRCKFWYFTTTKKYAGEFMSGQVVGMLRHDFKGDYDIRKFSHMANTFTDITSAYCVYSALIEDYAMGASGKVFNLAENCAMLKHSLLSSGIDYSVIAPTAVKKFATGKGNARKPDMVAAFTKETGVDLAMAAWGRDVPVLASGTDAVTDMVDAYFICKYLFTEAKRQGKIQPPNLGTVAP